MEEGPRRLRWLHREGVAHEEANFEATALAAMPCSFGSVLPTGGTTVGSTGRQPYGLRYPLCAVSPRRPSAVVLVC